MTERENDNQFLREDVNIEVVMIFDTDAIVQPWAVVVKGECVWSREHPEELEEG